MRIESAKIIPGRRNGTYRILMRTPDGEAFYLHHAGGPGGSTTPEFESKESAARAMWQMMQMAKGAA